MTRVPTADELASRIAQMPVGHTMPFLVSPWTISRETVELAVAQANAAVTGKVLVAAYQTDEQETRCRVDVSAA